MISRWMTVLPVLAVVAWPALLAAQDVPVLPSAPAEDEITADEAAEIEAMINRLTPEQLQELIERASAARLQVERETAAAEIRGDLLYEPRRKEEAIEILEGSPADTQADNIERILRAFAAADEDFANAYTRFAAKGYKSAADRAGELLDARNATYRSAALHFLYAEALFGQEKYDESVEAYRTLLTLMPDRISFASASAARCAEAYEQLGRLYYAMEMYAYCLQNYGLTISENRLDEIVTRLNTLEETYEDPLGAVAGRMGEVHKLLGKGDTGEKTRDKQQEIVRVLEDLIKTAEENQSRSQQQSSAQDQGQKQVQSKD
jgi:tetratricopeptide (TPR) repeat protein